MNTSVVEPLQHAVVEPLQNVIEKIEIPSAVTERLPDRFRPEQHRSRKPLLLLLLVVVAAVAAARYARRSSSSTDDSAAYNGSTSPNAGEPSFVDVR
jgi:hypothetical protein